MTRHFLSAIDRFLESRSQNVILLSCLAVSLAVGAVDYRGSEGVLIVYLVPIALAAWYGNRRVGFVIAIYCALAWFLQVIYVSSEGMLDKTQVITLFARLVTFMVVVQVISRLRSAIRLQKELTEFIVHDLRSPISSAITGLLTLKDSGSEFDPVDQEMIELSLVSNQRALELVNSMLDVSKLQSGMMVIEPRDVPMDEFLRNSVEPVELWAKGGNLRIETSTTVKTIHVDEDLTQRVVVNLLSNAIKFSPPNGAIELKAVMSGDQNLHFTVADQGPGIPPEYVSSIFEPFTQVKGAKGGTGLGLAFCQLAVQAQHGRIWAESRVGHGTTFHFILPKAVIN